MAFLILNRSGDAARERLVEIFWPDLDPDRARDNLSTALHSIRRGLRTAGVDARDYLLATKSVVRWAADTSADAAEFAEFAAREDAQATQKALTLYQGDFLEGDYDEWVVAERERLATLYETVLARAVRGFNDMVAARRLVARNPYDEQAYGAIVEGELTAGRRALAASWVERCRKELSAIGTEPSAAFEARFGTITHVEPVASDELTLPFVGRVPELATLSAKLIDAARGHGSLTLVRGEAGIGKTTLLERAAHIARQSGLRVLTASRVAGASEVFGPWRALFEAIGAGEDFDAFVRTHPGDAATAVAAAIATLVSVPSVLIVDDAQELAGEAFDVLVAVSKAFISEHAVVVATRPEGVARLRTGLVDIATEELPIGPLDRSGLQSALTQTLGIELPEVLDALYERSDGHPLFFAALLNALVHVGALTRNQHHWLLTKAIDADVELPNSIRQFIEVRLRERGDGARAVACALALEPEADCGDLAAALSLDESATLDALDDLLSLGVITQRVSHTPFAFTHDLVQEVAASGLNVGRRTVLHRAFAKRLEGDTRVKTSLRLARHLDAAGEYLAAARSYLKAGQEALELNAARDAIERSEAGIAATESLERAASHDALLSVLHRTVARAASALGDSDRAVLCARTAVSLARAAGDTGEATRSALDLAAFEGAAGNIADQRPTAVAAAEGARTCGDVAFEAEALLQIGNAERRLGRREEALHACRSSLGLASEAARFDLAGTAHAELLQVQFTWWSFDDALEAASAGLDIVRRAEPLVEAAFRQTRSALWYLLERFGQAETELQTAIRIAEETVMRAQVSTVAPIHPKPSVLFACHYMAAKLAIAQGDWDRALEAADEAAASYNVASLPRHKEALTLIRVDALLRRGRPGDGQRAKALVADLLEPALCRETTGWSDTAALARVRVAARLHEHDIAGDLRQAIDTLEDDAHRTPLDCDRVFAVLADTADEAGDVAVANRARARSQHFRGHRMALAGAAWGGSG